MPDTMLGRIALAVLFAWHTAQTEDERIEENAREVYDAKDVDNTLYHRIVEGVKAHTVAIDQRIGAHAPEWSVAQVDPIDLTCLRIAVFELDEEKRQPK